MPTTFDQGDYLTAARLRLGDDRDTRRAAPRGHGVAWAIRPPIAAMSRIERRLRQPIQLAVACSLGIGPLAIAIMYFIFGTTANDANRGAAFYLGVAIVVTPFLIVGAVAYYLSDR